MMCRCALPALHPSGFKPAGTIHAVSCLLWSLWLVALGVAVLML
jgi:hypothetical protein